MLYEIVHLIIIQHFACFVLEGLLISFNTLTESVVPFKKLYCSSNMIFYHVFAIYVVQKLGLGTLEGKSLWIPSTTFIYQSLLL